MSNNIDERVVSMKFDNKTFEQNAGSTLSTLDKLKQKLNFGDVSDASKKFSLNGVGDAIDGINAKFAAMATVGITALANITNRAVNAGIAVAKSLVVDPISSGLSEYETNLNSIQTILANTGLKGSEGLGKVNGALGELNKYSDMTIYNFSEMARNIGTFTAAGVNLDTSTSAIKGIANLAAVSGSNSQQASTAMYQLSQAMASGTVKLMDWNSVVNAGMGGKVFQDSLTETARAHGIAVDAMIKKNGSFRESLQEGWLTTDVLTETLQKFSGDLGKLSDQQLRSKGYTDAQIKGFRELGDMATSAAQDVKTGSQLLDTLKEAVGSGWSATWQIIFGDFEQAKKLWTGLSNALNPVIGAISDARNNSLKRIFDGWREMGGVDDLLKIITNTIQIFTNLVKPLKDAFGSVFPPSSTNVLKKITGFLSSLSDRLVSMTSNLSFFKAMFQGVFSIFKMAGTIVVGLVGGIGALVGKLVSWVSQLSFIQKIGQAFSQVGDFVARMSGYFDKLTSGDISGFITGLVSSLSSFSTIGGKASGIIQQIQNGLISLQKRMENFKTGLGGIASMLMKGDFIGSSKTFGWEEDERPVAFFLGIHDAIIKVRDAFHLFGKAADEQVTAKADAAVSGWQSFVNLVKGVGDFLKPGIDNIASFFGQVVSKIKSFFDKATFQDILALVNTGLFMGFYLAAKNFFTNFSKLFEEVGGTFKSISGVFDGITGSLKGMQNQLNAKALLEIAGAVGILAASVALLTLLDQGKVWSAVGAIGALTGAVVGTLVTLEKVGGDKGGFKILTLATAMGVLGGAIATMALAVVLLGNMPTEVLAKGLGSVIALVGGLVGAMVLMSKFAPDIAVSAGLMMSLSASIAILAGVIATLGLLPIEVLVKGVGSIVVILGILVGAMVLLAKFAPDVAIGAGLVLAIGAAMVLGAVGMLIGAVAMSALAAALMLFAKVEWGAIGKAATALGALSLALVIMSAGLAGAVAFTVVTAAMAAFIPVLAALALLPWNVVLKGLAVMAVAMGAIGLMGVFAPGIALLGASLVILGAGALLAGAGIFLFAQGFALLAVVGAAGLAAFTAIVIGVAQTIPLIAQQIGLGIQAFAFVIANAGPALVAALTTLLLSLLIAIDNVLPQLFVTLGHFVDQAVWFLESKAEVLFQAGLMLLLYMLNGINNNIGKIVDIAGSIIVNFINGLSRNLQKIIDAGGNLIINFIQGFGRKSGEILNAAVDTVSTFLDGLSSAAYRLSYKFTSVGGDIASAIIQGMADGITHGVGKVADTAKNMAVNAFNAAKNFLQINSPSKIFRSLGESTGEGFADGIDRNADLARTSATDMAQNAFDTVKNTLQRIGAMSPNDMNFNPTISPVIDLSNVEKSAALITGMLTPPPLALDTSLAATNDANAAVQAKAAVEAANEAAAAQDRGDTYVTLEQTNNSPKALSEIEIYRQTKNLISTAKEVTA